MRVLISFILLIQLLAAPALALPPTTLRGQLNPTKSVTFGLEVPHFQATRMSATSALLETGNSNILLDAGVEAPSTGSGWTIGSGVTATYTSDRVDGAQSGTATLASVNGTIVSNIANPGNSFEGVSMEFAMWVKTSVTGVQLCGLQGSTEVGCVAVPATGKWTPVVTNYPGPSVAPSYYGIRLKTTASTTGVVQWDAAYAGIARNIGSVSQATLYGSLKYSGSANCVWQRTGVTSWGTFAADTDCSTPTASGFASAPSTKIPGITFASLPPGDYAFTVNGTFFKTGGAAGSAFFRITDGTNNTSSGSVYHPSGESTGNMSMNGRLSYSAAQTNITFQLAAAVNNAANVANVQAWGEDFEISVYRYPTSNEQVFRPDVAPWRVEAIFGGNYLAGTSTVASFQYLTSSTTMTLGAGSATARMACSNAASTGLTCAGTPQYGISFDIPRPGDYKFCWNASNYMHFNASTSIEAYVQAVERNNSNDTVIQTKELSARPFWSPGAAAAQETNLHTCAVFSFASAGQKTISIQKSQTVAGTVANHLYTYSRMTVEPLNQQTPAPVLVGPFDQTRTITTSTTLALSDSTVFADATSGSLTATLPTAVGQAGKTITVRKSDSSGNSVTIAGQGGQLINGSASFYLGAVNNFVSIVSDGSNWQIVGQDVFHHVTAQSSTKTPTADGNFHSMSGNSITLPAGTWDLTGNVAFDQSGAASYNYLGVYWAATNGGDNGTPPAGPPGVISTGNGIYWASATSNGNNAINFVTAPATVVVVPAGTTQTLFLVARSFEVTPANARITAYLNAKRIR